MGSGRRGKDRVSEAPVKKIKGVKTEYIPCYIGSEWIVNSMIFTFCVAPNSLDPSASCFSYLIKVLGSLGDLYIWYEASSENLRSPHRANTIDIQANAFPSLEANRNMTTNKL